MSNKLNLQERLKLVKPQSIEKMNARIGVALVEREQFDRQMRPTDSHYFLSQVKKKLRFNKTFPTFLHLLDIDPDLVLNNSRISGRRADIKGVLSLIQFVDYISGKSNRMCYPYMALLAATIIAANHEQYFLSNADAERILRDIDVSSMEGDIAEAILQYKQVLLNYVGDDRPEACRFRTTFENIGCYTITNHDPDGLNRTGIMINPDSLVIDYLRTLWRLT